MSNIENSSYKYRLKVDGKYINDWQIQKQWMEFFECIGKFVQTRNNINLYISYLDEILPALFISKGIIESQLEYYKRHDDIPKLEVGDEIALLTDLKNEIWRKAKVLDVYYDSSKIALNPFAKLKIILGKNNTYDNHIPFRDWNTKIRMNPNFKSTAGSIVKLDDSISDFLRRKYSVNYLKNLKMKNQNIVNLIGNNIEQTIYDYMKIFNFNNEKHHYKLDDIIHHSGKVKNYSNTQIIKSRNYTNDITNNEVSIFLGDNSSLIFSEYRTERNIFISNRKKSNLQHQEIFLDSFLNDSYGNNCLEVNKEIKEFLKKYKIEIPKGVEIYGY
ncbi:hypothetical protein [Mammaliicoccus sciuri]|uniref:hypothetical protein n=1 Tax=Mammaliicoccus sciuri TaxID=1296 RepID=UPI001FB53045|nr:hypothetical protein [Mammaliicoccus sciuri]MCJ1785530.1 hypothetical protein [Mammaliicoccus sciuri]